MTEQQQEPFEGWAVVEVMGHRRLAGWVKEETRFGQTMLRIDIPAKEEGGDPITQYYSGSSLFCVTPTTGEVVKKLNEPLAPGEPYRLTYQEFRGSAYDEDRYG